MKPLASYAPRLFAGVGLLALLGAVGLVSSRPAHSVGGPVPVTVTNAPLAVRDAEAARTPFQTQITPGVDIGSVLPIVYAYESNFTVPAGKRLVLQSISASFSVARNARPVIRLTTTADGSRAGHYFSAPISPNTSVFGTTTTIDSPVLSEQPLTAYADAGSNVNIYIDNLNTSEIQEHGTVVTLTGYLVDAP